MIDVVDLTVDYGDVTAVHDVDLEVGGGEFITIIGPSGCGKTTLLQAIGGLQEPANGRVLIDERSPDLAQAEGNLGFVFQQHTLFPWKTALQNVTFLRKIAGKSPRPERARELALTVEPVRRNRPELAVGNVVGSTAFYTTANVGLVAVLHPVGTGGDVLTVHWPFLAGCLVVVTAMLARGRVTRLGGVVLFGLYIAYWVANYL